MSPRDIVRRWAILLAVLATFASAAAQAHLTPNSEVRLVIGRDQVIADIVVPQGEYGYATGSPVGNDAAALAKARSYLVDRIDVVGPDGRHWSVALRSVTFEQIAGPPDLHAVAVLTPPQGGGTRVFTIDWRVLVEELPSHFALFVLAGDSAGMLGEGREILGAVRASETRLAVDRGAPSTKMAFANAMLLGIDHILEGYDHLLFILALLLPAPFVARAGRWSDHRSLEGTIYQLLRIVTAFTIGHSLTLVGATVWHLKLPPAPVEVIIALSVLISALHAIRPLFPGREPVVALLFGLTHGLAFATLLADAGVGMVSEGVSLLGFNLGIEVVQIGIIGLVMPPLFVLLRLPAFAWLRVGSGAFAAAAALAWIFDRTTGGASAVVMAFESVMAHAAWIIAALLALAAACLIGSRKGVGVARWLPDAKSGQQGGR